jgi:2-dehydro-3-deoxygluconokinase
MRNVTVTFGEIMLRLAPPDFERFLQSPRFDASFGGGEANVAVALAQFGLRSVYVSVLPEKNPFADAWESPSRAISTSARTSFRNMRLDYREVHL